MQKTMQAIVKAKPEPGLWLEQVPVPEVGPDDVLIRTKKASICGTDIHIYNWDDWAQKTIPVPMTIGHEFVGEIASVGTNVRGFAQGDLVVGKVTSLAGIAGIVSPAAATSARIHWASALIAPEPGPNLSLSRRATRGMPILPFRSMSFPVLIR